MAPTTHEEDGWLSLQEASRRIGVSRATLRSWADRGRVHAFRTPGGHRRFRERDLATFATSDRENAAVQALRVVADAALGRTRFEVADGWLAKKDWYQSFPAVAREEHRELGRQVILALAELMSGPEEADAVSTRAADLGKAYGELSLKYGISLNDDLRAFLFFRDSFIKSLTELAKSAPALDLLVLLRRASYFVDTILLAMVETCTAATKRKRKSG
jgi:excisionase family DNA binding protein